MSGVIRPDVPGGQLSDRPHTHKALGVAPGRGELSPDVPAANPGRN